MSTPPPSALLMQLFRLQEAERHRVGRALHNQVGQALSAIKMAAHLVQAEDDPALRAEDLQEIVRASDETVAVLRDLHATLYPPQLDAIGLDAALRAELDRVFPGEAPGHALAPLPHAPEAEVALVAFRIAQAIAQAVARTGGTLAAALSGDAGADGGLVLDLETGADLPLAELPLLQALATAAGGGLESRGAHGNGWRLRLPYSPLPLPSADPA